MIGDYAVLARTRRFAQRVVDHIFDNIFIRIILVRIGERALPIHGETSNAYRSLACDVNVRVRDTLVARETSEFLNRMR